MNNLQPTAPFLKAEHLVFNTHPCVWVLNRGWSVIGEPFWVMCFFSMFAVHMLFYLFLLLCLFLLYSSVPKHYHRPMHGNWFSRSSPIPCHHLATRCLLRYCWCVTLSCDHNYITTHCAIDVLQELANEYNNKPFSLEHSKCNSQYCES